MWFESFHLLHNGQVVNGHSLGWEVSMGRLQVDLRGSRSSGPICPSMSLFNIIQLVLYKEREREPERERWKEVTDDDDKVWVSKLVNGCTVFIDFKKMTRKRDADKQIKTHMHTLTHLAILPILPRCSRSCKTVTCYRMSWLICWVFCHSAPLCCTINSSINHPSTMRLSAAESISREFTMNCVCGYLNEVLNLMNMIHWSSEIHPSVPD